MFTGTGADHEDAHGTNPIGSAGRGDQRQVGVGGDSVRRRTAGMALTSGAPVTRRPMLCCGLSILEQVLHQSPSAHGDGGAREEAFDDRPPFVRRRDTDVVEQHL